jgi:hypothetical protein
MIPSGFNDFLDFVLTQTRSKKLKWMSGEGSSYLVSHKDMSLYISSDYDPDRDVSNFWFRLISDDGQSTPFSVYEYERADYNVMRILYEEIIFNANNAEHNLNKFMRGFDL